MSENQTLKRIAVGCGVLAVLAGIAFAFFGYFGYKTAKKIKADAENPGPRALEILGAERLPDGYFPNAAVAVPFIMDTVIISDQENLGGKPTGFGKGQGFLFTQVLLGEEKDSEGLEAFFTGKSDDYSALAKNRINIELDIKKLLARGVLAMNGMQVRYLTVKDGFNSAGEGLSVSQKNEDGLSIETQDLKSEGLTTLFMFECPQSKKLRFGIWYSDKRLEEPYDLTGTVGDEAKIIEFLDHFRLCGEEAEAPAPPPAPDQAP